MLWKARGKLIDRKAKDFHRECMQTCWREIPLHRVARKVDYFFVPVEPTLAFFSPQQNQNHQWVCPKFYKVEQCLVFKIFKGTFTHETSPRGLPSLTQPCSLHSSSDTTGSVHRCALPWFLFPCQSFWEPSLIPRTGQGAPDLAPPILKHVTLPQLP